MWWSGTSKWFGIMFYLPILGILGLVNVFLSEILQIFIILYFWFSNIQIDGNQLVFSLGWDPIADLIISAGLLY